MNRIASRGIILVILASLLALGFGLFVIEFIIKSGSWVVQPGSPHVFSGSQVVSIKGGAVVDSEGVLLLDMEEEKFIYSSDEKIRKATVHWVGDRYGNVEVFALANYVDNMVEHDILNGLYAYSEKEIVTQMTINSRMQVAALEALGDYKGTVAIYNYKTGQLLCSVSTPTFDPEKPPEEVKETDSFYWNRFLYSTPTPGSIFKTVTLAAALETIPDIESKTFFCNGSIEFNDVDKVTCMAPHGQMTLKDAFRKSCNCVFSQLALEIGAETLNEYVQKFGVIDSIEFDGIDTSSGNYSDTREPVFVGLGAIGQHKDQINPCAFMVFMGAIANGGKQVMPYLIEQVTADGEVTYKADITFGDQIMSEETAQTVHAYLRNNVAQKYGDDNFPGLNVCAKTGTAEVGEEQRPNAMFAGFVEDSEYPLAFVVCVEDGGLGQDVGMPIIRDVLSVCKAIMDEG